MGFGKFVNKALHQAERHVFRPVAHAAPQVAPVILAGAIAGPQAAAIVCAATNPPSNLVDAVSLVVPEVKAVVEAVKHPEQAILSAAVGPEKANLVKHPEQAILAAAVGSSPGMHHIPNHVPETKEGDHDPFWLSDATTHDPRRDHYASRPWQEKDSSVLEQANPRGNQGVVRTSATDGRRSM
jgi:hypothetical protein